MTSLQLELLSFAGSVNLSFSLEIYVSLSATQFLLSSSEARKDEAARLRPDQKSVKFGVGFFRAGVQFVPHTTHHIHPAHGIGVKVEGGGEIKRRSNGGRGAEREEEEIIWRKGRKEARKGVLEMIVLGWARISGGNSTNVLQKSISGANENRPESLFSLAAPVSLGESRTSLGKEVIARMSAYSRTPLQRKGCRRRRRR